MTDKPVYVPERVPYRGTHYVEAEAFDRALAAYERETRRADAAGRALRSRADRLDRPEGAETLSLWKRVLTWFL